jgi:hypothetical protein
MKAFFCSMLTLALSMNVHAKLVTKTVSYEQNGTKLEGYLAYDDSATEKGKVPGVVVFPEWWGLNNYIKSRADQLANMGTSRLPLICSVMANRLQSWQKPRNSPASFTANR